MKVSPEREACFDKEDQLRGSILNERDGARAVTLAKEMVEVDDHWAGGVAGCALIAGRPDVAERRFHRWRYFRLNGVEQRMTIAEFVAAGGVPDQAQSSDLLRSYVFSGRWELLPPHHPENTRDASGDLWRLYMAVLKAFIARDKKKIAAAIRRVDKARKPVLAYAIVREARKMGLDPKIKKYDF
jgi:hypothetical protein